MNIELMKFIEDFDNGKEVKTVEMGGISDGYEKAIQRLAIEIMRVLVMVKIPDEQDNFVALLNMAENSAMEACNEYGYSGAQVGAAKNLAAIYYKQTPEKALSMLEDKTRIMVMSCNEAGQIQLSKSFNDL